MLMHEFDALPRPDAERALRACADVASWASALAAGRPYGDRSALLAGAADLAAGWTPAEVDEALADHPRIGERHAGGAGAALSSREQAGVGDDARLRERLAQGNARYEERFGRIYLVRAAGRSGEELLAMLEERLHHDPGTEAEVTRGQLAEIALLRLEALVS